MSKGMLITFEGGEGSGKSTQVREIGKLLEASGIFPVITLEPGGTGLGRALRAHLLEERAVRTSSLSELLLFCADRAQHMHEVIVPALNNGRLILCDRFADATLAYQGYGRGIDLGIVAMLNKLATGGIEPDITFFLDIPVEAGLERVARRARENFVHDTERRGWQDGYWADRFEEEELGFHQRVREGYLFLAQAEPNRIVVIDGALDAKAISERIYSTIKAKLGR